MRGAWLRERRSGLPLRWVIALVVVAVLVLGLLVVRAFTADRSALHAALKGVPATTKRFSFTDWEAIRSAVGVHGGDATKSGEGDWIERGYERDLTPVSSIWSSADLLQQHLGFSPGNLDWEAVAQSPDGNSLLLKVADGVDFGDIEKKLTDTGFVKPSDSKGVWAADPDKVGVSAPTLPVDLRFLVLLAGSHWIVASDERAAAEAAGDAARGKTKVLAEANNVGEVAGHVSNAAAVMLWAGDFACTDLAMSQADKDSQTTAADLIRQAGDVSPLSGMAMGLTTAGNLTVVEQFESGSQASRNLNARARLAVGPAVGRSSSTFADDLRLTSAKADGASVLLTMKAARSGAFPLSSLYSGPLVFASC